PPLFPPPLPPPLTSTLFPYTTLFRSHEGLHLVDRVVHGTFLRSGGLADALQASPYRRRGLDFPRDLLFFFFVEALEPGPRGRPPDRKSTRLNSSHVAISYAVFCLKKK